MMHVAPQPVALTHTEQTGHGSWPAASHQFDSDLPMRTAGASHLDPEDISLKLVQGSLRYANRGKNRDLSTSLSGGSLDGLRGVPEVSLRVQ